MAPREGGWRFAGSSDRNLAEYFSLEALFRSVAGFSLSLGCAFDCAVWVGLSESVRSAWNSLSRSYPVVLVDGSAHRRPPTATCR